MRFSGSIFGAGSPGQVTMSGRSTSETSWIFIPRRIVRDDDRTGRRGACLSRFRCASGGALHPRVGAPRVSLFGEVPGPPASVRDGAALLDVPVEALWRLDIPSYSATECPLCAKGIPAVHPGTTPAPVIVSR